MTAASAFCAALALALLASAHAGALHGSLRANAELDDLDALLAHGNVDAVSGCEVVNVRPMIGVLTQPDPQVAAEYVAGSYVKYLEGAGARVVPIRYNADDEELRRVFDSVNGILFPGGAAELSPGHQYFDTSAKLYRWTLEAQDRGVHIPLWGTCLGFEQLLVLAAGSNETILRASGAYDAENYPSPFSVTDNAADSQLLGSMPRAMLAAATSQNITFNAHGQGVHPDVFAGNPKLSSFFTDLATYVDRKGRPFVAAVEAADGRPVFGVQFHPEKTVYEWFMPTQIPHAPAAVRLAHWLADFFVAHARCNAQRFPGGFEQECKEVLQVRAKKHVVNFNSYFEEVYTF